MAKDPAFLFYPGDWLGGTMYLTHEQKGAYMDLLMLQFNKGKFTIAQAKQVLSICFANVWDVLSEKFETDGKHYWNHKLKEEVEKRKKFTDSRRKNALSKEKEEKNPEAYAKHMEDEDVNVNNNKGVENFEDPLKAYIDRNPAEYKKEYNDYAIEICDYLNVPNPDSGAGSTKGFRYIRQFVVNMDEFGKLDYFKSQFQYYRIVWSATDLKKHSYQNFLGTYDNRYEDGAWCSKDWRKEAGGPSTGKSYQEQLKKLHAL